MDDEFKCLPGLCGNFHDELADWWQARYTNCLVSYRGQSWFVKSKSVNDKKRHLLAYYLGNQLANVGEVKGLDREEFTVLRNNGVDLPPDANWRNTYLVRFAQESTSDELPKATLDSAIASELVFSMWIRRRDAHSFNRSVVAGTTVFYDHGTAFLGAPALGSIDDFFRTGPDPGYAGLWRLRLTPVHEISTLSLRRKEREQFAERGGDSYNYLLIIDRIRFVAELDIARDQIKSLSQAFIKACVKKAGFGFPLRGIVVRFLLANQNRIESEAIRLKLVLGV
jgi:hypothetical protein